MPQQPTVHRASLFLSWYILYIYKYDKFNGGYMEDTRTTDNLFILNGLIQRQLNLGKSLFVCFVDFSKAFDLVNRSILFYKLLKLGWGGRVIDTLRNLYSKTKFRVKRNGMLSSPILNEIGVNQGGICSGILFGKIYLIWASIWQVSLECALAKTWLGIYFGPMI